jgi:hypothetical protein
MHPNLIKGRDRYQAKRKWKQSELKLIKDNYKKYSDAQISKFLLPHRSARAVQTVRLDLGIRRGPHNQRWTPEEVETLLKVWKDYDQRQISERFIPNKTPIQVNAKKQIMKLHKPPVWTNEERGLLLDHGADYSSDDLRRMFFKNKTNNQIAWMRKHLGVRRRCNE